MTVAADSWVLIEVKIKKSSQQIPNKKFAFKKNPLSFWLNRPL